MLADVALIQLALIGGYLLRFYYLIVIQGVNTLQERSEVAAANAEAAIPQSDMAATQTEVAAKLAVAYSDLAFGYITSYWHFALLLTPVCLLVFYWNGFYTYGRHYQSRYKALVVSQAVTFSYGIALVLHFFLQHGQGEGSYVVFPRMAIVLAYVLSLLLLVGARIWTHLWRGTIQPEGEVFARNRSGNNRRVLVIGGAGYIGSALLPKLLDRGYHVRLLDLLFFGESPIAKYLEHPNVELIQGDFRHVENVVEAMRDVDAVIHLGAIVGDPACSLDEELSIDVNLSATRMIAELAKAAKVDRFIFASTCSVYGACDETLDEHSEVIPVSLYGHTKLASERVLRSMSDDQFSPTIVRFSTIYGLSGRTRFDLVVNLLAAKAKIDGEITVHGGDQWRPFVHVDDAAHAVAMILDSPTEIVKNQIFNVGSNDQNYTIQQIAELVLQQVVSANILVSEDAVDIRNYRVDFSKIRNQIGFNPQWTVEAGIQQVLEAIASGEVSDYRDTQYSNFKYLTESGTTGLARDNWARELIRSISTQ